MDWNKQNIKVYDESAEELAHYFSGIGSRINDIEKGLSLLHASTPIKAIEIGCGDGRDAVEIIKRVDWYEGVDPSQGLLSIAKNKNPDTSFVLADALSYDYPKAIDIIFAFASLLHVNREDIVEVFSKAAASLIDGGIFYISLKEKSEYTEEVKEDKYGKRMFYYYNSGLIEELAGELFEKVFESHNTMGSTAWFTVALRKKTQTITDR